MDLYDHLISEMQRLTGAKGGDPIIGGSFALPFATLIFGEMLRTMRLDAERGGEPVADLDRAVAFVKMHVDMVAGEIDGDYERRGEAMERGKALNIVRPPVAISRALRRAVYERDNYQCVRCGERFDITCDHIYPVSRGGPTTLDNLQTLCRPCNSSKGARIESV